MRFGISFFIVCLSLSLFAATVYTVPTTGWVDSGETNGWVYVGLNSPYKDGAVKFNAQDDLITSPLFHGDISSIEIDCRSSSATPTRILTLVVSAKGQPVGDPIPLTPTETNDHFDYQTVSLDPSLHIDNFTLALQGSGSDAWGLYGIRVTLNENRAYSLRTTFIGQNSFTAAWSNGADVASSILSVFTTNAIPFHADFSEFYDFMFITNQTGSLRSVRDLVCSHYSNLDGLELNAPNNSTNLFVIGSSTKFGYLDIDPRKSYAGCVFLLNAARYWTAKNEEGSIFSVDAILGDKTNTLATLELSYEPQTFRIPVDALPDEAILRINAVTNRVTKDGDGFRWHARTIINNFGFATNLVEAHVQTNVLLTTSVVGTHVRVTHLEPLTDYLWTIRGLMKDGSEGQLEPPALVRTRARSGLNVILK